MLDEFITGYLEAAQFTDGPCEDPDTDDCEPFLTANADDVAAYAERMGVWHGSDTTRGADATYSAYERAGTDFWLSRNGHGAGFFDRGLGELGDRLQDAARVYGEVYCETDGEED